MLRKPPIYSTMNESLLYIMLSGENCRVIHQICGMLLKPVIRLIDENRYMALIRNYKKSFQVTIFRARQCQERFIFKFKAVIKSENPLLSVKPFVAGSLIIHFDIFTTSIFWLILFIDFFFLQNCSSTPRITTETGQKR